MCKSNLLHKPFNLERSQKDADGETVTDQHGQALYDPVEVIAGNIQKKRMTDKTPEGQEKTITVDLFMSRESLLKDDRINGRYIVQEETNYGEYILK